MKFDKITYRQSVEDYILEKGDYVTSAEISKHFGLCSQHASAILRDIENTTNHYCISEFVRGVRNMRLSKTRIPLKSRATRKQQLMRLALFGESLT